MKTSLLIVGLLMALSCYGVRPHLPPAEDQGDPREQPSADVVPQPAGYPEPSPETRVTLMPAMDKVGAELGAKLQYLDGEEWERVYREHIRHIQMAQEAARLRDLQGETLAGKR